STALAKLPIAFVENRGQTDARVRYYAQGSRYAFYLTADDVEFAFASKQPAIETALALRFVAAIRLRFPRARCRSTARSTTSSDPIRLAGLLTFSDTVRSFIGNCGTASTRGCTKTPAC